MKLKLLTFYTRINYYLFLLKRFVFSERTKLEKVIEDNLAKETFTYFQKYFEKSVLLKSKIKIRDYSITKSLLNDKNKENYYLEFGVNKGDSSNFFSKYVNKLYAFDSFEGLEEDWAGTHSAKGRLNHNREVPKLNSNIEPIVGWVEDTLEDFLKKHSPKINFVHLDMDTFTPTKFTLMKLKPYLLNNAIIIFDELYNFPGWKNGEFKALTEVFDEKEYEYRAFNLRGKQVVIQIKK
jgi:hypothetical protein